MRVFERASPVRPPPAELTNFKPVQRPHKRPNLPIPSDSCTTPDLSSRLFSCDNLTGTSGWFCFDGNIAILFRALTYIGGRGFARRRQLRSDPGLQSIARV